MTKYAFFPAIKSGVAFTDPWYKEDVWCQYRKDFKDFNWYMKMDAQQTYPGITDLLITFGNGIVAGRVSPEQTTESLSFTHPAHYNVQSVELGIDSARMFFGSLKDLQEYGESIAFRTGGDGLCGDLYVFTAKGMDQPSGFLLSCSFTDEFVTAEDVFRHLVSSFEGQEITKAKFTNFVSPSNLMNRMVLTNELKAGAQEKQGPSPAPEKGPER